MISVSRHGCLREDAGIIVGLPRWLPACCTAQVGRVGTVRRHRLTFRHMRLSTYAPFDICGVLAAASRTFAIGQVRGQVTRADLHHRQCGQPTAFASLVWGGPVHAQEGGENEPLDVFERKRSS
jgi:hypothetical protein